MARAKGELESQILETLRDAPTALTVKDVQGRLGGAVPAVTTIITVLERMRVKGLVGRSATGGRSYEYFAARSRVDQATASIQDALSFAGDRNAALLLLAGSLTDSDREVLRRALERD
jgi:predicted transcriptional regulator